MGDCGECARLFGSIPRLEIVLTVRSVMNESIEINSQLIDEAEFDPDRSVGGNLARQPEKSEGARKVESRRPVGLLTEQQLKEFSQRSDGIALVYTLTHYSLIGLLGWIIWMAFPSPWCVPVLLIQAFVIGFLFSPLHECAHGTAFRSRWLNESVLWVTALVYVVPPYFFRYFHLGHHRYTQVPGKDPSLVLPEPASFKQYLWYCAAFWFWWRNLSWIIRHAAGQVDPASNTYVPKARIHLMVLEARVMLALYGVVALVVISTGYGWALLLCWLLPRFLGEPVQRVLRVAEHVGCEESPDLLKNTRTTLSNRWIHLIAWQMPYHAEHHLYPNVPFSQLSAVHRVIAKRVIVESDGYLRGQRRIIRWLRETPSDHQGRSFETPVL